MEEKKKPTTFYLEERLLTLLAWIHSWLLCALTYFPVAAVLKLNRAEAGAYFLTSAGLLLPIVGSWLCIRKVKNFLLYLLLSLIVCLAAAAGTGSIQTGILGAAVCLIRSYARITRGKMLEELPVDAPKPEIWEFPTILDRPSKPCWIPFCVFYVVLILVGSDHLLKPMRLLLLGEMVVYHLFAGMDRMKSFVLRYRRLANLPVRVMQHIHRAILGISLVLLLVLLLPAVLYKEEPLTAIRSFRLDLEVEQPVLENGQPMAMDGLQEMLEELYGQEATEPPAWLEPLLNLIAGVIFAGGMLLAVILIYQACRRMLRSFSQGKGEDEIILLDQRHGEQKEKIRTVEKRENLSENRRIRKLYRKIILKHSGQRPSGWETPDELEVRLEQKNTEQAAVFHRVYEKARYGKESCSAEERKLFWQAGREQFSEK